RTRLPDVGLMEKITRFTSEEREDLAAYLDGELDEKRAAEIELKLTRSEYARREVEILNRTWDMLGLLPQPNVSGEFSRKTMAIARQTEEPLYDKSKTALRWGRRVACLSGWGVALCLAASAGYQITNRMIPDKSRLLVEELPIINNLDNYREIGDVEFLRQLRSTHVFQEEAPRDPPR
ncbi:MAG: hypothetical protein JWN70_7103, partial [Planctomycetaceae bacterium]|nr:hypothetical protein [Planctomycetaceae bacterium]